MASPRMSRANPLLPVHEGRAGTRALHAASASANALLGTVGLGRWLLAFNLNGAVVEQRYDRAHGCNHRREHGAHDSRRHRELGDLPAFVLDDDPANVTLVDQLLEPSKHRSAFHLDRFPKGLVRHVVTPAIDVARLRPSTPGAF